MRLRKIIAELQEYLAGTQQRYCLCEYVKKFLPELKFLGEGGTRVVFGYKSLAIKVGFITCLRNGIDANTREWYKWFHEIRKTPSERGFARCRWMSADKRILIMDRIDGQTLETWTHHEEIDNWIRCFAMSADWKEKNELSHGPNIIRENKTDRLVSVDYAG